ncbi:MAG: shikimate dehydrogenase [Gammaproteobacteria bacterium]|nr:shikimate dehydrogenase [Gammaproteobacteria bacterium]
MGNPIAHSLSPRIHRIFARQTGQTLSYEALLVPIDGFAEAVAAFRNSGGKGMNVTLPFKREAWEVVNERTPRAARAGAVNTIVIHEDGRLTGDNTDGAGLLRDLTINNDIRIADAEVLLLGAGGAARGVLEPLLAAQPKRVVIANRTADKSRQLARDFGDLGYVDGCGLDELHGNNFNLIINGTAAGVQGEAPEIPHDSLQKRGCCYDMFYGREPTAFVRWGLQHGAVKSIDGLGMLVEQAAESFALWRDVRPKAREVIAALAPWRTDHRLPRDV